VLLQLINDTNSSAEEKIILYSSITDLRGIHKAKFGRCQNLKVLKVPRIGMIEKRTAQRKMQPKNLSAAKIGNMA
jgi:hypothetical protein